MRNILTYILILVFISCGNVKSVYETKILDSDINSIKNILDKSNAKDVNKTILVFTTGFEQDSLELSNENDVIYNKSLNTMSTGMALAKVVDNNKSVKIRFYSNKREDIILKSKKLKKYKFIYISKNLNKNNQYLITYSNVYKGFS